MRFVLAGGRKATLCGLPYQLAAQIVCDSSSTQSELINAASRESRRPPVTIPIAIADVEGESESAPGSARGKMMPTLPSLLPRSGTAGLYAGGCTIGSVPPAASSAPPISEAAAGELQADDTEGRAARKARVAAAVEAHGGSVDELVALAKEGQVAARQRLQSLGVTKLGERLRLEHELMQMAVTGRAVTDGAVAA